ncbi:MAG: hypothetical protein M3177_00935 [Pseudomonadota bacterium]|nr:hypothetical protein [Pseudomonadota bacterium]
MLAWFAAMAAAPADPVNAATEPNCFDADVSATIVRQTPTVMPECEDCIIMRWPWIVDLRVNSVHVGSVGRGLLTVLTLQHAHYRTDLGARRWLLRRNTLGSFNVVHHPEGGTLPRCSADAPAATPFIRPADGETLEGLRREGEEL